MNEAGESIRRYLVIARRQWWVVLQAMVVVGAVAAFLASRTDPLPYRSSVVLVATEPVGTGVNAQQASLQLMLRSRDVYDVTVLQAAAAEVPNETASTVRATIAATPDARAGTITITAVAPSADRPQPIASAVSEAFLTFQREKRTESFRALLADTETQAKAAGARLVELEPRVLTDSAAKAEQDALRTKLGELFSSMEDLKRDITGAAAGFETLDAAGPASRGALPSPVSRGAQGAAAGLIIGIGLAALREALDNRLRDRAAITRELPWPVIGELVTVDSVGRSLVMHDRPTGPVAEAIRRMRTNLRFVEGDEPVRSIVITSPKPGDGKTFLAANLAVSYAQLGVRTVVVSADLRRPTLDHFFVAQPGRGLSELLELSAPDHLARHTNADWTPAENVEQYLRFTGIANLWLLPAGQLRDNPAELLSAEHAHKLFDQLALAAEMVIIDAPPLMVVDPLVLGAMADGVIVVASATDAERRSARHAREVLESSRCRVLGLALNRVSNKDTEYGYYGVDVRSRR